MLHARRKLTSCDSRRDEDEQIHWGVADVGNGLKAEIRQIRQSSKIGPFSATQVIEI
jgi:hypothetical protein